ncbi:MAG: hypothetical protein V3W44_10140 [Dehalococcoidales bacterium]
MRMELNQEEAQYIVSSMDLYVKSNGLPVAGMGLVIMTKIQEAAKSHQAAVAAAAAITAKKQEKDKGQED